MAGLGLAAGSDAQTYPAKSIRFVVPFAAGSATDTVARLNGEKITEALAKLVGTETEKWARIVKTAGIQPD